MTQALDEDDLVFKEAPLVGMQDSVNKREILACSQCMQFLGPLERQLGWRLAHGKATSECKSGHEAVKTNFCRTTPYQKLCRASRLNKEWQAACTN